MRRAGSASIAVAAVIALSSCAQAYDDATRQSLRQHVVAVSQASAAGDWQGAVAGLDVLAADLSAARDAGKVDAERFDSIVAAMEVVRSDLNAAIAAAEDEAERQRLLEEQAQLQQQITELQNQGAGGEGEEKKDEKGEKGKGKGKD